tara:strand:- start:590 stop:1831 length:1242 start_codon:yes stop_codon:yes gene_type:complete
MHLTLDKSNWQKVRFGDVVKKVNNKIDPNEYDSDIVIQGGHINKRDFHIREYENKKELGYLGPAFHMGFKKGQILYVSRNPHLMKVGYPHFDGICANTTFIMETKDEDVLSNNLIPFIMHSDTFIEQSVGNVRGGVNPYVNWGDLACIEFLLPSKEQQAKIAELLWAMDDVVEKEKEVLEKLLINERVNINDLFFHKDIGQCKKSKLGYIPNNWDCVTLQELLEKGSIVSHLDGNHGSFYPKAEEFVDSGVPYISANCIENGEINLNNAKYLTIERASVFTKGVACDGDILLAHNATVGPVCMLKTQLEKIILSTTLTYYRVNDKDVSSKYLYYYMQSDLFQKQLKRVMSQSTRNQVPITTQRKLYFIIPPLNEQNLIATSINQVKTPLESSKGHIESSMQLQKSLINEIFSS